MISSDHPLINHPMFKVEGNFVASATNFVRAYNSHIFSSHKKVDPVRLANLTAFMNQFKL